MRYWNSNGMQRCCVLLEESTYRLQKMADECREHMDTACLYAQERALLSLTYEKIAETARLTDVMAETVTRIGSIYEKNEQRIADYFDLTVRRAPQTKLGISTFENLKKHEAQMPFENR